MNVYFDYQIFQFQRFGGISRYFFELAKELNQLQDCKAKIIVPYNSNEYIFQGRHEDHVLTFNYLLQKTFYNRFYNKQTEINELALKTLVALNKTSIVHETYYVSRIKVNAPKVITIHDMIYELFNTGLQGEKDTVLFKKQAIHEADVIIAVSENTKKDLLNFYPEAKNKTFVVHHGVDNSTHADVKPYVTEKPYILHVGNRGWYKNFDALLDVFASNKNIHQSFNLVCFGGGNFTEKEIEFIEKNQLQNKVKYISGNDKLLIALYKGAAVLAYISSYEGFGMPILEAMALSCPILSSNTSSMPEVYGNAAVSINPKDKAALENGLNSILFNTAIRSELIELGLQRVKQFSWKKCALETQTIYKKLNG